MTDDDRKPHRYIYPEPISVGMARAWKGEEPGPPKTKRIEVEPWKGSVLADMRTLHHRVYRDTAAKPSHFILGWATFLEFKKELLARAGATVVERNGEPIAFMDVPVLWDASERGIACFAHDPLLVPFGRGVHDM